MITLATYSTYITDCVLYTAATVVCVFLLYSHKENKPFPVLNNADLWTFLNSSDSTTYSLVWALVQPALHTSISVGNINLKQVFLTIVWNVTNTIFCVFWWVHYLFVLVCLFLVFEAFRVALFRLEIPTQQLDLQMQDIMKQHTSCI